MSIILGFNNQHLPAFGNHWLRFLLLGILLVALGIAAIYGSTTATLLTVVFLGAIILVSGVLMLIDSFSFWRGKGGGFFLHLLFAILYILVGCLFIKNPLAGSLSVTFLLGIVYLIMGVFRIALYPAMGTPRWGWGWFNGVITLLLGIMILLSWPASSLFIIGLFVGIDLLFCGWAYIMAALAARNHRGQIA